MWNFASPAQNYARSRGAISGERRSLSPDVLAEFRACGDRIVDHDEVQLFLALFRVDGGKQHAAGLETHHLSGRQVHNRNERLADELLGLIELVDAGENLSVGAGAVVEREPEKLVALFDRARRL